jgi:hypothetical protein
MWLACAGEVASDSAPTTAYNPNRRDITFVV